MQEEQPRRHYADQAPIFLLSSRCSSIRSTGGRVLVDQIDDAIFVLLLLGRHDDVRAWKGHDCAALDRLHQKGYISNPVSKAKSLVFTDEGLREAERLFNRLFARS